MSMDKEIEWTTLILMFPTLDLTEIDTSYALINDLCEHFNKLDRPDLWKHWLSLNLAENGEKLEFKTSYTSDLNDNFGINEDNHE